jgi:hypothetical protein
LWGILAIHNPGMLIPLPGRNLCTQYDDHNYKQGNTRIVIEQAFGRLKGIWRVLHRCIRNPNETLVSMLIYVSCFLLNVMLKHNDIMDDDILLISHYDEGRCQQMFRQVVKSEVEEIQDAIIEHLALKNMPH